MPFDWMSSPPAEPPAGRTKAAREADLSERAKMLLRLGYDSAEVKARLQRELEWEFELAGTPPSKRRLNELIKAAQKRHEV